MGEWGYKYTQL